eukprot:CAMPEP_0117427238 /NCGR_PEP_ID=MMETSP0758-20121206/7135_1 /TAXON_ID=63605 /ORGANISM="Percolomonas cosmopolitus, Strain AE-1 (ATCC 50343)" /LENGTH=409 /DNA_ID=CAMNT_0005212773 /DNA_START=68 /DNA_END=1297 /DNA_ORIENTATION=+
MRGGGGVKIADKKTTKKKVFKSRYHLDAKPNDVPKRGSIVTNESKQPLLRKFMSYKDRCDALCEDTSFSNPFDSNTSNFESNLKNQSQATFECRVLTYNLLAPCYAVYHVNEQSNMKCFDWKYRSKLIQKEIQAYAPDIIGFQEMESSKYKHFISGIVNQEGSLDYKFTFIQKTMAKLDGVSVGYNSSRFQLLQEKKIRTAKDYDFLVEMDEDEPNYHVSIIQTLQEKETGGIFLHATIHTYWNPKYEYMKLIQAHVLNKNIAMERQKIAKLLNIPEDNIPILITGDFNSTPDSCSVAYYTKGRVMIDDVLPKKQQAKFLKFMDIEKELVNPLGACCQPFPDYPDTNVTKDFHSSLDYIWYTAGGNISPIEVLEPATLNEQEYLPNALHPSDHLPMAATFKVIATTQPN